MQETLDLLAVSYELQADPQCLEQVTKIRPDLPRILRRLHDARHRPDTTVHIRNRQLLLLSNLEKYGHRLLREGDEVRDEENFEYIVFHTVRELEEHITMTEEGLDYQMSQLPRLYANSNNAITQEQYVDGDDDEDDPEQPEHLTGLASLWRRCRTHSWSGH